MIDPHDVEERAAMLLEHVELPAVERPIRALALDGAPLRLFVAVALDARRPSGARWHSGYVRSLDDVDAVLDASDLSHSESA